MKNKPLKKRVPINLLPKIFIRGYEICYGYYSVVMDCVNGCINMHLRDVTFAGMPFSKYPNLEIAHDELRNIKFVIGKKKYCAKASIDGNNEKMTLTFFADNRFLHKRERGK